MGKFIDMTKDEKSQITNIVFRFIHDESALDGLKELLAEVEYTHFRAGLKDRNGKPMFGLKNENENAGLIVCSNEHIANLACEILEDYRRES